MESILLIIISILVIIIGILLIIKTKHQYQTITKTGTVNEPSYQRYAKFYDNVVPVDSNFEIKINKIYNLIEVDKLRDIRKIAEKANCSYEECILKIKYLKNKRQLGTYSLDHKNGMLYACNEEEFKLIEKYKPYIYYNHLSISEIACRMPGVTNENLAETKEKIYQEINALYNSNLLNGIKLNEIDKEIIYYTIEKRKKEKDFITISCPNCGALNDLNRGSKTRCAYCNTIIEDIVPAEIKIIE